MTDHIQFNGNVDLQSNNLDNVENINGSSGVPINIAPVAGQIIEANSQILGVMSGSNAAQLSTQAYADANSFYSVTSFPTVLSPIQLGTPGSSISPGSSYTYTISLPGTFVEVAIANFGWVEQNTVTLDEPGVAFGRGVMAQAPQGGVLIANATSSGWHRGFTITPYEYQDDSSTPVTQLFFASSNNITNPLGYGISAKQVIMDNLQLETTPPGKLEVSNVYLGTPSGGNTPLYITVKNVDSISFSLTAYYGVQLVYGYLGDPRWTAVSSSNMLVVSEIVPSYNTWISTNNGSSFTNYPVSQSLGGYPHALFQTAGMCAWQVSGVQYVAMVDTAGYVISGSSASSFSYAVVSNVATNVGVSDGSWSGGYQYTDTPYGLGQPLSISSDATLMALVANGTSSDLKIFLSSNQGSTFTLKYTGSSALSNYVSDFGSLNINYSYSKCINSTTAFAAFNYYGTYPDASQGACNVLLKTVNTGTAFTTPMTHPEFLYATETMIYVSDNGSDIFLACLGYGNGTSSGLYGGNDNNLKFNYSSNGGSTWANASGSWVEITSNVNVAYTAYSTNTLPGTSLLQGNGSEVLALFVDNSGFPNISRSLDSGVTWSVVNAGSQLVAYNSGAPAPAANYFAGGTSANDSLLAYVDYGVATNTTQSYVYSGTTISTFTNWPLFGR